MPLIPAIRLALGPILLWQGARTRRTILRLPEPAGPRAGTSGTGPPCRLLILGDSSAAGVGVRTREAALSGHLVRRLAAEWRVSWRVLAKTGWTTADALAAMPGLDGARFDIALISLGVNDATTEVGLRQWLGTYHTLLDRLHDRHGLNRIYVSGLPPMQHFTAMPQPLRWYMGQVAAARSRALARAMANRRAGAAVIYLPLDFPMAPDEISTDGFHPGPTIYDRWGAHGAAALLRDGLGRARTGDQRSAPAKEQSL